MYNINKLAAVAAVLWVQRWWQSIFLQHLPSRNMWGRGGKTDSCGLFLDIKVKVKVALWGFSTLRPFGLLYSYPQQVPAFISRGATHHTDTWDLYQRRRELLPMNFASKSVIHERTRFFYMPQSWDIFFYFPSEGRHTEDFPDAWKIQRLRPGLNSRTRAPVASMLTTRPPKPSSWI